MYDPPGYVWAITLAGVLGVPAVTCAVLYRAGQGWRIAAGAAVVFAGWLAASAVIAGRGWYDVAPGQVPVLPLAMVGFLALLLALRRIPVVARALAAPPTLARLHWPHAVRVVGVFFLLYLALGHLPAVFAVPAGVGDIVAGLAAPLVAWRLARGAGRRAAVWFNAFGIADLAVGVTLGTLTSYRLLDVSPSSAPIGQLPLALVLTATVPLFLVLHLTALSALARTARQAPAALTPAGAG